MVVLNFSKPLTPELMRRIGAFTQRRVELVEDVRAEFSAGESYEVQARALLDQVTLTRRQWTDLGMVVILPDDSVAAVVLVAAVAGRRGRLPTIVRIGPAEDGEATALESLSLHDVRKNARDH